MFTRDYAYDIAPVDFVDFRARRHDMGYDKLFAVGASSLKLDLGTTPVDLEAYASWNNFLKTSMVGMPDPYNEQPITGTEINAAARAKTLFFGVLAYKFSAISSFMTENYSNEVQKPDTDGALKFNYNLFLAKYMEKDNEGDWRRKKEMWNVDENKNYTPKKSSEIKQE